MARARDEGKHIGRPFREINWLKVYNYLARGIAVGRFKDDELKHSLNTLLLQRHGEREKKVDSVKEFSMIYAKRPSMFYVVTVRVIVNIK